MIFNEVFFSVHRRIGRQIGKSNFLTVQRFLFTTCTTLHKKNEYKNEKKVVGNRIYNPMGLD